MTAERIGPGFVGIVGGAMSVTSCPAKIWSEPFAGKTWSNPLCCHFLAPSLTGNQGMTAERIGLNFAGELFQELWLPHVVCFLIMLPMGMTIERTGPNSAGQEIVGMA